MGSRGPTFIVRGASSGTFQQQVPQWHSYLAFSSCCFKMLNIWKRRHNNIHSTKEPNQDATKTLLERLRLKTILLAPIETFVLLPSFPFLSEATKVINKK